jgi:hypothetical protein
MAVFNGVVVLKLDRFHNNISMTSYLREYRGKFTIHALFYSRIPFFLSGQRFFILFLIFLSRKLYLLLIVILKRFVAFL